MNDRATVLLGGLVGAAAGVVVSYLLFTESGRQLRRELEPELDTLLKEAGRVKAAVDQVRQGMAELQAEAGESDWPRRRA